MAPSLECTAIKFWIRPPLRHQWRIRARQNVSSKIISEAHERRVATAKTTLQGQLQGSRARTTVCVLVDLNSSVFTSVRGGKRPTLSGITPGLASRAEPPDLEGIAARRGWCLSYHRLPASSPFSIHPWRWHSRPAARWPSASQLSPCQ
jgi:hypothetical protein